MLYRFSSLLPIVLSLLAGQLPAEPTTLERIPVAKVWSGHPVGFSLLTHDDLQFVAFYDADRQMTVGVRELDSSDWTFKKLPEKVGWDSHNSITMKLDSKKHLHLSGNMHCVPIVYFRTAEPRDIQTFERVESLVGENEDRATYPKFITGPNSEFIFTYRDGSSGSGNQIYDVYDVETNQWKRLLDQPLTDGQGEMNAYLHGPVKGPDGVYHLCWVWRDTPDCETNHTLSYARSSDLVHWENSDETPIKLPMTLETAEVVDPVPPGGGILNGNTKIGFDHEGRAVISYHKNDEEGNTQIYNARLEESGWKIYKISDWDYHWDFQGRGSIITEISLSSVRPGEEGRLLQSYGHKKYGGGVWVLDESDFSILETRPKEPSYPRELSQVQSEIPGMRVNWSGDSGGSNEQGVRYNLRWETLERNRDRPREGEPPPPTWLEVVKLRN
ncbi:MAG: BNR-4 repeat-containing protein [Candidatus Omnitrophica bacterium]|nr:BNR-4 repeat-containing protein [Candidatus Omnitrophota bacterium]